MPLPPGYLDPQSYLVSAKFHLSHTFTASTVRPTTTTTPPPKNRVTYALVGSEDDKAPVVVFLNGMGGNRICSYFFDGFLAERGVRLLTIDRPGVGGSTSVPVTDRIAWTSSALHSVLAHHSITSFSLWSHSNGILYTLEFLSSLSAIPDPPTVKGYFLSSPYVPPWLSSSIPLQAARWIPGAATGKFGNLVEGAAAVFLPVMKSFAWSSGNANAVSSALFTPLARGPQPQAPSASADTTEPSSSTSNDEAQSRFKLEAAYLRALSRNVLLPLSERRYGSSYYSPACADLAETFIIAEGLVSFGDEALICLRKGCKWWSWESEEVEEAKLYEEAVERLRAFLVKEEIGFHVVYGSSDGLIPKKGRDYLKNLLKGEEGGARSVLKSWKELDGMGHDEVLGLEMVLEEIADMTLGK